MMITDKKCEPNIGSWEINEQMVQDLAKQNAET